VARASSLWGLVGRKVDSALTNPRRLEACATKCKIAAGTAALQKAQTSRQFRQD